MTTPTTPERLRRPILGARSLTASAKFQSPPRQNIADHADAKPSKRHTEAVDVGKKQRSFFHPTGHDHKHHLSALGKRAGGDAAASKTHLRHHLHPVEGLQKFISDKTPTEASGLTRLTQDVESHERQQDPNLAKVKSRQVRPEDVDRERRRNVLRER